MAPTPAPQPQLEAERHRLAVLKKESTEILAYHDLRRQGLEATDRLYQTLLEQVDQQLSAPPAA